MKLTTSVIISGLSGSSGDVVASKWKGRPYLRTRVIPANPQSAAQTLQREAMARTVACWQSLPEDIKADLDTLGTADKMSGFNRMVKACVADEKASHGHDIFPANRFAPPLQNFAAATGAGASGTATLTWDVGDYAADDTFDVYARMKNAVGDEYATPWVQLDTSAGAMDDESFVTAALEAATDYMFAMVPRDTGEAFFGKGDFANATTVA